VGILIPKDPKPGWWSGPVSRKQYIVTTAVVLACVVGYARYQDRLIEANMLSSIGREKQNLQTLRVLHSEDVKAILDSQRAMNQNVGRLIGAMDTLTKELVQGGKK
jgi:hypothetical protein